MKDITAPLIAIAIVAVLILLVMFVDENRQKMPHVITDDPAEVRAFVQSCEGTTSINHEGEFYVLRCQK